MRGGAKAGLPPSLLDAIQALARVALTHGPGEAFNALARNPRLDAKLKGRIRPILRGALKDH